MNYPIAAAGLLPQTGDMVLLDEVLACEEDTLVARARIRPCHYSRPDGSLPPWVGLELMAQGVAAWAGVQARRAGEPVKLGFLLGTRHYECQVDAFMVGSLLTIEVTRTLQDSLGMGMFHGRILDAGREVAQARVNVYQPEDALLLTQEPLST